jgi:hypothetical protein
MAAGDRYKSTRGSSAPNAASYLDVIGQLSERLAPGGQVETSEFGRIDEQAGMLANRMEGANIARGLGNATLGVAPTVSRMATGQKEQTRSNLLNQYLSTLQFLVGAQQSQQQIDQNAVASRGPTNAQRGLDVFGRPMGGTLAEAELNLANARLQAAINPEQQPPTPERLPSLYGAGGAGVQFDFGENPFASLQVTGQQPVTPQYDWTSPISGYGELESGFRVGTPMVTSNKV